jgi:hypothetical protein
MNADPADVSGMIVNVLPGSCRIGRLDENGEPTGEWYTLKGVRSAEFEIDREALRRELNVDRYDPDDMTTWTFRQIAEWERQRQVAPRRNGELRSSWSFTDDAAENRRRQIRQEIAIGFAVHRPNAFQRVTHEDTDSIESSRVSGGEFVSYDEYRHVPGLPGVSETCWADKWISYCYQDHEHDENCPGDYEECCGDVVNEVGVCEEHAAKMRGADD